MPDAAAEIAFPEAAIDWLINPNSAQTAIPQFSALRYTELNPIMNHATPLLTIHFKKIVQVQCLMWPICNAFPEMPFFYRPLMPRPYD